MNEFDGIKRADDEEDFDYQFRVARYFLQASCPDWPRHDELSHALVDAFNDLPDSGRPGWDF